MSESAPSNAATPLRDSAALVTGAGSGIGRAVARQLAAAGAKVGVLGRAEEKLRVTADEIIAAGGDVMMLAADVTHRAAVDHAVASLVTSFGPITILVNSAGAGRSAPFSKTTDDVWSDMLAANLTS